MINIVVEGASDQALARAVVEAANHEVGRVVIKNGKTRLDPLIPNYNRAAVHSPWVVFRDSDTQCPVQLHRRLTKSIDSFSPRFLLRIGHPMSEGWLLADQKGFAKFFEVRESLIPGDPDILQNAKQTVLALCVKSRSRLVAKDMVVRNGQTGPLYTDRINEFAANSWDVHAAALKSESLKRAIDRIGQISDR